MITCIYMLHLKYNSSASKLSSKSVVLLFHLCSNLELGEVVTESSKSVFLFLILLQYMFADFYKATVTDFQLLSFGNLNILLHI